MGKAAVSSTVSICKVLAFHVEVFLAVLLIKPTPISADLFNDEDAGWLFPIVLQVANTVWLIKEGLTHVKYENLFIPKNWKIYSE